MSKSSVKPNGDAVFKCRKNQGLSQEKLALATNYEVSAKTIGRMEKGLPCHLESLRVIAEAMKVHPQFLIEDCEVPPCFQSPLDALGIEFEAYPKPGKMRLKINIAKVFKTFKEDDLSKVIEEVAEFAGNRLADLIKEKVIKMLEDGSVKITIDLPADLGEQLIDHIRAEKMLRLGAVGAEPVALGRDAKVSCPKIWDWLVEVLCQKVGHEECELDPRDTFAALGADDELAVASIRQMCKAYKVGATEEKPFFDPSGTESLDTFEKFVLEKYGITSIESWGIVPIGDVCDFVHENHGLGDESSDCDQ